MELTQNTRSAVNRGAITMIEAMIWFVLVLAVLAVAITQGGGLFNRNDGNTEYSNAAELMTNTRTMLKTSGIYNFAAADAMTGALIQFGGRRPTCRLSVPNPRVAPSCKTCGGRCHRATRGNGRWAKILLLSDLRGRSSTGVHYSSDKTECGAECCYHHGQRHIDEWPDRGQRRGGAVYCR